MQHLTRRTRAGGLAAVAVSLALVGAACSSSGSSQQATGTTTTTTPGIRLQGFEREGTPVDGGKVVIGLEAESSGWDPTANGWAGVGHYVASAIFDPLTTLDEQGNAVPYLAESLTPDANGTVWTIRLSDGVTFHDGTKLDADAVKLNLDRQRASATTGNAVSAIKSVDVVDPRTVRVTMSQPWISFPYTLTTQVGYMAAPSMLNSPEGATKPVGTGPYVFQSWTPDQSLTATRNADYWQPGKPHLAEIEFRPIPDADARLAALRNGTVDMIHTPVPGDVAQLRGTDFTTVENANGEETFIVLNTVKPPFDDPIARQAVAYATDTKAFVDAVGAGLTRAANGPFVPGQLGYREQTGYPTFDLEKAKALVKEYEQKHGQPLSFTYKGGATLADRQGQQLLSEMWRKAGMQVDVATIKQANQIATGVIGDYQAIDWRNHGSPDPDGEYVWWHSKTIVPVGGISTNVPRYGDPQLDKALDDARATDDPTKRDEDFALVAERLNAGVPSIWLTHVDWALAASPRVHGFRPAQNGSISTLGAKTWMADLWVSG